MDRVEQLLEIEAEVALRQQHQAGEFLDIDWKQLYGNNPRPWWRYVSVGNPLSNWTELDIWQYIARERIEIVPLYFSALRLTYERDGQIFMADDPDRLRAVLGHPVALVERWVRFRTLGCWPLTGAVESRAATLNEVIQEMLLTTTSERQGRVIDHDPGASMELKKAEGYF